MAAGGCAVKAHPPSSSEAIGQTGYPACQSCGGQCDDPGATLAQPDCQWFGNRLARFHEARPDDAPNLAELAAEGLDADDLEAIQMEAFEDGVAEWWLLTGEEDARTLRFH